MWVWLTSTEHYFWDVPRRAQVCEVYPGPEPGSEYARLYIHDDEPDGPMDLAVRRRDGQGWSPPVPGQNVDVMVWVIEDSREAWTPSGVALPRPRPDAWCLICATEQGARAGGNRNGVAR